MASLTCGEPPLFKYLSKSSSSAPTDITSLISILSIDFPTEEWGKFYDDIDGAKQKILDAQTQAASNLAAVQALNAAFDAIQGGGGSTQSIIEALDAYEADPNNPPLDTTDIRDIISDGADTEDVKRYLDFGGSPQVRELLVSSQQAEQDAQKLSSMGIIAELIKQGENI